MCSMWPQTLQMTRDECLGILRRLELESYSHVISVFRAQGGLNEPKTKLLEELRGIFHISQERHRAEARRVANDEQLCTIAEAISGPNTSQEWSREGRRPYPLLPRVAPKHAISIIADDLAEKTAALNNKLPLPSETGKFAAAERKAIKAEERVGRNVHVVTGEPFKVPDVPTEVKRNMKRSNPDVLTASTANKKRYYADGVSKSMHHPHITANSNIAQVSNTSGKVHNHQGRLLQMRYFQQQQEKHKQYTLKAEKAAQARLAALEKKQGLATVAAIGKQQVPAKSKGHTQAAKSGRRAQKLLKQQQQSQRKHQQHQQQQQLQLQQLHNQELIKQNTTVGSVGLQASIEQQLQTKAANLSSPTTGSPLTLISSPNLKEKSLISTTPVQKYIVEERQPPQIMNFLQLSSPGSKLSVANSAILPSGAKLTPKKLNNSTSPTVILDPANVVKGNPLNAQIAQIGATSPQLMTAVTAATLKQAGMPTTTTATTATTSKTAIISSSSSNLKDKQLISTPVQKYIVEDRQQMMQAITAATVTTITTTTTNSVGMTNVVASGISNIINSLPPNALKGTLVTPLTPPSGAVFRKAPANLIKTIGVATSVASTNIGNFAKNANNGVNPSNIINTANNNNSSSSSSTTTTTINTGGPQIISNIKLTSATSHLVSPFNLKHVTASCGLRTSVKICQSPNGKVFIQPANLSEASKLKLQTGLQHTKINTMATLPAVAVSPSPAQQSVTNMAASTISAGAPTSSATSSVQRIAIQKVQIIPAPVPPSSSTVSSSVVTKPTTFTIAGSKTNTIFIPASATGAMRQITLSKANTIVAAKCADAISKPANVVVIGPQSLQATTTSAPISTQSPNSTTKKPIQSQFITEDTPIDILSLPIYVEEEEETTAAPAAAAVAAVTSTMPAASVRADSAFKNQQTLITTVPTASVTLQQQQSTTQQTEQQSMLILGPTDWEMELDQATGALQSTSQSNGSSQNSSNENSVSKDTAEEQSQHSKIMDADAIIIDESLEDVIVEEEVVLSADEQEVQVITAEEICGPVTASITQLDIKNPMHSTYNLEQQPTLFVNATPVATTKMFIDTAVTVAKGTRTGNIVDAVAIDENIAAEYMELEQAKLSAATSFETLEAVLKEHHQQSVLNSSAEAIVAAKLYGSEPKQLIKATTAPQTILTTPAQH